MPAASEHQPLPVAAGFHCLLGIIIGVLLFGVTSVAAVMATFLTGFGVVPLLSRMFNPLPWMVLILLSNVLSLALFMWCRRKARFFAFGLLGGSLGGCALNLLYALSVYLNAIATAPQPGMFSGTLF